MEGRQARMRSPFHSWGSGCLSVRCLKCLDKRSETEYICGISVSPQQWNASWTHGGGPESTRNSFAPAVGNTENWASDPQCLVSIMGLLR